MDYFDEIPAAYVLKYLSLFLLSNSFRQVNCGLGTGKCDFLACRRRIAALLDLLQHAISSTGIGGDSCCGKERVQQLRAIAIEDINANIAQAPPACP